MLQQHVEAQLTGRGTPAASQARLSETAARLPWTKLAGFNPGSNQRNPSRLPPSAESIPVGLPAEELAMTT